MNKLYISLILIPILTYGCKIRDIDNNIYTQSIDSFTMNIFSSKGNKIFTIKSPFSSYNKENNIFNLKDTTIYLFKDNEPQYIINSDKSKLSNNKLLELKGNVLLKTLLRENDVIYANSFTWNIDNSEYLLTGNVKLENNTIALSSNKAILNKGNDIIEFFNPVKYIIKSRANKNSYEINSENAYYDINTKSVSFRSIEKRVRSKIYF
tara:strand:- start:90 stop:713 length:624 start_codon:yes stop_codon:yes gene_type:complete